MRIIYGTVLGLALGIAAELSGASAQDRPLFSTNESLSPGQSSVPFHENELANSQTDSIGYGAGEIVSTNAEYNYSANSMIFERLSALETELYTLRSESLVEQVEEKPAKPTFELGGRIHLDYWNFAHSSPGIGFFEHPPMMPATPIDRTDPEDRWAFRRVRLEMEGDIPENLFWRMQVDFNTVEDGEFKDVYMGMKGLPLNQRVTLGFHKRPIGLDHWNSSRFNVFTERPFVVEAFNEDTRRLGLSMSGHNDEESWFWQYGLYNLENFKDDGKYIGDSSNLSLNARIGGSPWYEDEEHWSHWAIAGMIGYPDGDTNASETNRNDGRFFTRPEARTDARWLDTGRIAGINHYDILALEGMLNLGPLQLTGEYMHNWVSRNAASGPDLDFYGYYFYAAYFLTGDAMTYKRDVGMLDRPNIRNSFFFAKDRFGEYHANSWGAWQVAFRYSFLDITDGTGPTAVMGGVGESYTYAVNWWVSPYAHIQFNLIRGSIEQHADAGGFTSGDYTIAGTRFAVDF